MQKTILNLTNIFYNSLVVRLFRRKTNMKKVWKRGAAFALAASVAYSQNVMSLVYSADKNSDSVEWNTDAEVSVEYLTLQPGETDSAVNLNWYAPTGTEKAIVKFGDRIVEASVEELHTPTKVDKNKYTDTGKMVCKATVDGLTKDTEYQYQVSYDDGKTWSEINSYKTAKENEFKFGFTSDPQIKENGESNKEGWNSSDGTNQTGWATMLDKLMQENVNLVVSAGDQVEDQSWGKSCIEDYSDSTQRGMAPFYEALDRLSSSPSSSDSDADDKLVRIAVFGDSFIEADIMTADLREMFQKRFGGCGVGFVTITSMTSGYRPTVRHTFGGWSSHSVMDTVYFDRKKQGISGHYFIPRSGAYVELRGQNKYASLLDTCQQASIFFYNRDSVQLSARVNRGESRSYSLGASGHLQKIQVNGRIGSIRWSVDRADSTLFYGLAMDGKQGIILDNFSLRGSSGLSLRGIPKQMLRQFNEQRPYDLIILEYGLNVATERGRNYDNYQKGLLTAINHLKECFPQAGILLLSVGDRDYKTETGDLRTMPGVKNLIRYQQNIAAESGIAFWNMFEAMGGEGSMAKLVHAKPSMANYDYTHINFRGGKHLAGLLYETLIYGKEQYDRRRAYEKE